MTKITVDPLRSAVLDSPNFFYETSDAWVDRYSHPLKTASGSEPSVYTPGAGGTSGKLAFEWQPYTAENFSKAYFPVLPEGQGVLVREVHLITGSALESFGANSKIQSDVLAVEWTNDGGKTITTYQIVKVEVPTALSQAEFYDQATSVALKGNDEIIGSSRNDTIKGFAGNDTINGGSGIDTAVYTGSYKQYHVDLAAGTVTDTVASRDGADRIDNVERLQFADTAISLDVAGTAGQGYRLYKAAFDRAPDAEGLGYWINNFDHGAWLTGVANSFIASPEFQAMYGANSSNDTFVTLLYQHVQHRAPDAQGLAYWNAELNAAHMTRGAVLASFSEAPENVAQTASLVAQGIQYQPWLG